MGLFSKKKYADTIFIHGTVETMDPDFPEAEAIAVKDGTVLALGDEEDVRAFENRDTETVDLEGACVVPGFFTMDSTLIREAYASFARPLDPSQDGEAVLSALRSCVAENPESGLYLAFGYRDGLSFGGSPRVLLDGISPGVPMLVLSMSGLSAIANSAALTLAHKTLEEELRAIAGAGEVRLVPQGRSSAADAVLRTKTDEGIDLEGEAEDDRSDGLLRDDLSEAARNGNPWFLFRDILPGHQYFERDEANVPTGLLVGPSTISQFLNLLGAIDETELAKAVVDASIAYAKRGYTTLLDSGSPDAFVRGFMSTAAMLIENGLPLQRNVVTTLVPQETDTYLALQRMAQKETLCVECADFLSAAGLRFEIRSADGEPSLSSAFLEEFATRALDHGFDVLATADGLPAADAALEGLGAAREKARKGRLVVRLSGISAGEEETLRDAFDTAEIPVIGEPKTPAQILSVLTGRPRHLLHAFENAGRIAVGEPADFAVLARSPFENADEEGNGAEDPREIPVLFTVLSGFVVSTDPAEYELPEGEEFEAFEEFERFESLEEE